jgi:phosphoserine aminotransferase
MKKHNFAAGPSILSPYTIKHTAEGILDLDQSGLSIMEISHRSKEFMAIMEETQQLFKDLLDIPSGYSVLLLQGGASMQFCMVPYNLLETKAAYLDTGSWANKAIKEAYTFGEVDVVASSKESTYSYIPRDYKVPADADYFHITTNNTIYGTEIKEDLDCEVNLVADMSSDIFSRPMDVSKYALIYGGAQKNLAPSGVTFVIIKEDILGKVDRSIPTMLDYRTHIDKGSMFNTPPCVAIYAAMHTLRWYKEQGGVEAMYKLNLEKAAILYDEIDRNPLFVSGITNEADRSIMNVTFVMSEEYKEKEAEFLTFATERGMSGIKGHRSVGGFRASIYNAMPRASVEALIDTMKAFEKLI